MTPFVLTVMLVVFAPIHAVSAKPPAPAEGGKTLLCHHGKRISVPDPGAAAHLKHGDTRVLADDSLCNNVDDDCDGKVDEDFTGIPAECAPVTFTCTGSQDTYTVPPGVTGVLIDARGGYGYGPTTPSGAVNGGLPGAGGRVLMQHAVTPGEQWTIFVGCAATGRQGGWGAGVGGDGGTGTKYGTHGGGGGGSSAIYDSNGLLVMAGGGGGGGGNEFGPDAPHPEIGPWAGSGGNGTTPATPGGDGHCNGVGCDIARGGCEGCAGHIEGEAGESVKGLVGGGGGGGGGGFLGGGGGDGARVPDDLSLGRPRKGAPPPASDIGEAAGGGGGQSFARAGQDDFFLYLTNVDDTDGSVTIRAVAETWQFFPCAGGQFSTVIVPDRATEIHVEAVGGSGYLSSFGGKTRGTQANGIGGGGGVVRSVIPVGDGVNQMAPGTALLVIAGCQGSGTGGAGWGSGGDHGSSSSDSAQDGGGGGGASGIGIAFSDPLVIAGGGGGGGGGSTEGAGGQGGNGGASGTVNGSPGTGLAPGDGGCEGCENDPTAPFDGVDGEGGDDGGGGAGGGGWPGGGRGHSGDGAGGGAGGVSATASGYTMNTSIGVANVAGDGYVLVSFVPPPPMAIGAVSGGGQSAMIGSTFAQPLVAKVTDFAGNPSPGVQVLFGFSGSGGPSGVFSDGTQEAVVQTDANGIATSPPITAAVATGTWRAGAFVNQVTMDATFALTNTPASTMVTVWTEPAIPTPNEPVVVTAWVVSMGGVPTGDVTITVQGTPHVVPLDEEGLAVLPLAAGTLTLGQSTIDASYAGDATHTPSTGSTPLEVVPTPTSTNLSSSQNPTLPGTAITFDATITVPSGTAPCTGCRVTFRMDGSLLGVVPVDASHKATFGPIATLSDGPHLITADFEGGSTFVTSADQLVQVVGALMQVGSNVFPAWYGGDLTLVADVFGVDVLPTRPTGTVTFLTSSGLGCVDVPLNLLAQCDLGNALPVGTYDFVVSYSGDTLYPPVQQAFPIPVDTNQTTLTMNAPASAEEATPFDIHVSITTQLPATLPLSGTVQLYVDGILWDGGELFTVEPDGTAVLTDTLIFSAGQHTLRADYSGTPAGYGASSASATIEITPNLSARPSAAAARRAKRRGE